MAACTARAVFSAFQARGPAEERQSQARTDDRLTLGQRPNGGRHDLWDAGQRPQHRDMKTEVRVTPTPSPTGFLGLLHCPRQFRLAATVSIQELRPEASTAAFYMVHRRSKQLRHGSHFCYVNGLRITT